jgi:hypothetical protein
MLNPPARWDHSGNLRVKTTASIVCLFVFGARFPSVPGPPHSRGFYITHSDAPYSVGLLRKSDQFVAETSTRQKTTITTDKLPYPRRNSNPYSQQRAAADLRLRPRGHWNRYSSYCLNEFRDFKVLTGVPFVCNPWVRFLWAIKCTKPTLYPSIMFISRVRLHRFDNTRFFFQYAAFISSFTNDIYWTIPQSTNQI